MFHFNKLFNFGDNLVVALQNSLHHDFKFIKNFTYPKTRVNFLISCRGILSDLYNKIKC